MLARRIILSATAAAAVAATGPAPARVAGDTHREKAVALAGTDYAVWAKRMCYGRAETSGPAPMLPATKVFDNLVFLGWRADMGNAWALLTSDGIILFDTLGTGEEAQTYIVDGLTSLGLDPMTIKRIVVMHGHADHYGGAAYLQALTGAPVYMSAIDWNFVAAEAAKGPRDPERLSRIPRRDRILADGEALTLGDTSVRFFLTPGHTPGTLSAILPVVDHGEQHVVAYWGGAAIPPALTGAQAYLASVDRFAPAAGKAGVDAFVSNHPTNDLTLSRLPALAAREPGAAHPFVVGRRGAARMFDILRECARAARADAAESKP